MVTPRRERNPMAPQTSFRRAAERYIAEGGREKYLLPIIDHFGSRTIGDIDQDPGAVEAAVKAIGPHLTPSSAQTTIINPISVILNFAFDRGRRRGSGKKPPRWLTPDEAERLIEAASHPQRIGLRDPQLWTLQKILFMLGTGAAPGEVITVEAGALDRTTGEWNLPGIPSMVRPRKILPPRRTIDALDIPFKGQAFLSPNGQPYVVRHKGGGQMAEAFGQVCQAAGLEKEVTPAVCRTTWAVWFYAQVPDLDLLVTAGGWAGPRSPKPLTRLAPTGLNQWLYEKGWDFRDSAAAQQSEIAPFANRPAP